MRYHPPFVAVVLALSLAASAHAQTPALSLVTTTSPALVNVPEPTPPLQRTRVTQPITAPESKPTPPVVGTSAPLVNSGVTPLTNPQGVRPLVDVNNLNKITLPTADITLADKPGTVRATAPKASDTKTRRYHHTTTYGSGYYPPNDSGDVSVIDQGATWGISVDGRPFIRETPFVPLREVTPGREGYAIFPADRRTDTSARTSSKGIEIFALKSPAQFEAPDGSTVTLPNDGRTYVVVRRTRQ